MRGFVEINNCLKKSSSIYFYNCKMLAFQTKTDWKYFWIELLFFISISYIIPTLNNIEYGYFLKNDFWFFLEHVQSTIVWGTWNFIFYAAYYWLFLKRFVFERKTYYVLFSILICAIAFNLYFKYIVSWLTWQFPFFSDRINNAGKRNLRELRPISNIIPFANARLFVVIGFTYLVRSLQQDDQMKRMKEAQIIAEMTYLKAQLQPHFFFNTLNNIYALALKTSLYTAPMIAKLSEMMRYIIYESEQPKVPLSREIEFLRHYVEVEKIRYNAVTDIQFDVQVQLPDYQIPPLLLLPLVENAFKHGLQDEVGVGYVHIVLYASERELVLQVKNSKPKHRPVAMEGLGLKNLKKRLDLVYLNQYQYEITADQISYCSQLTLNIQ